MNIPVPLETSTNNPKNSDQIRKIKTSGESDADTIVYAELDDNRGKKSESAVLYIPNIMPFCKNDKIIESY